MEKTIDKEKKPRKKPRKKPTPVVTVEYKILQELKAIKEILDNMWRERRPT